MDDFELELKAGFLEEAEQAITDVEEAFIELETNPENSEVLDKIFRLAHNLKGSSKAVGFDDMGEFTHKLESFLLLLKDGVLPVTNEAVTLLLRCSDMITHMIEELKQDFEAQVDCEDLKSELIRFSEVSNSPAAAAPEVVAVEETSAAVETAEVPEPVTDESALEPNIELLRELGALDEIEALGGGVEVSEVQSTEPSVSVEPVAVQPVEPVEQSTAQPTPAAPKKSDEPKKKVVADESIRISLGRLETLVNYVGEMSILQAVMQEQIRGSSPILVKTVGQMGKVMKEVQDISMSLRMVPIKPVFMKMQRIVRDIASTLDKKVHFEVVGGETEVDKTVLEKIGDPLVHLVRNSVDHGIENPADRENSGKSEQGLVELKAFHKGGRLVIEVSDDGKGLNPDIMRQKGIEKGVLQPGEEISDQAAMELIFHPGFSTKEQVTDISGRGVGMDVVKTNIESMSGEVALMSEPGIGTCFQISLPLTLAIIDAMILRVGEHRYVIPLNHVVESVLPQEDDIRYASGIGEVLYLRGENIPLHRLGRMLGVPGETDKQNNDLSVVVMRVGAASVAIVVDEIIGQSQVVIKQLGLEAQSFKGISATTILGDGKPALILEISDLVAPTSRQSRGVQRGMAA